jgi:hypothetical protein
MIACAICASVMSAGKGGTLFDIMLGDPQSQIARTDFDFKLTFFMIGALVVGVIGYAVHQANIDEQIYRSEADIQPVPIAQHKSTHGARKSHAHHVVPTKK